MDERNTMDSAEHKVPGMLPNFLIVGAPKCGTTSVADWLAEHPECFMEPTQEPFYLVDEPLAAAQLKAFAETGEPPRPSIWSDGWEGYSRLFQEAGDARIRFEATTHYLFQQTALKKLSAVTPLPKILIMLRKPSERLFSSFNFEQNHLASVRSSYTFAQYVDDLIARRHDNIIRQCANAGSAHTMVAGLDYGQYEKYVGAWRYAFGDNLRVWVTEKIRGNEVEHIKGLAQWLDIDATWFDNRALVASNVGYRVRFPALHKVARWGARRIKVPRPINQTYWKLVRGSHRERRPSDVEALARLDRFFAPSVVTLLRREPMLVEVGSWLPRD